MVRELLRALLIEATRHPAGASHADLLRGIGQWTTALPRAAQAAVDELLGGARVAPDVVDALRSKAASGAIATEVRSMVAKILKHVDLSAPLLSGPAGAAAGRYVDVDLAVEAQDGLWRDRVDLAEVSGQEVTLTSVRARWGQPGEPLDVEDDRLALLAWLWQRAHGGARFHMRLLTPGGILDRGSRSAAEIADLGLRFEARGAASRLAVGGAQPQADVPRCGRCPVRQGCELWWSVERPREAAGPERIVDVEVEILPSASSRVRAARVLAVSASISGLEVGASVEIAQDLSAPVGLSGADPGARLRLINWRGTPPTQEDDVCWLLSPVQASAQTGWRASEVFRVV